MALARKCDKCNTLYIPETREINSEKFNAFALIKRDLNGGYRLNSSYDLCPDCLDSLIKWITNDSQKEA